MQDVILYILMRTDLKSMNPGKAMAQASHAANACAFEGRASNFINFIDIKEMFYAWQGSTPQGFGTCIVLDGGKMDAIKDKIEEIRAIAKLYNEPIISGIVHDPSYHLMDGSTLHRIPLDTCAYVMCYRDSEIARELKDFKLHA